MNNPKITWRIKNNKNDKYSISNDYFIGNVNGNESKTIYIQVWNNYQGLSDVLDLENAKLTIKALNIDDAYVFNYLSIKVNGSTVSLNKYSDLKYYIPVGNLYGSRNNGDENAQALLTNKNMCDIELTFFKVDYKVKENIKNLIFDIESN